jgi:UDP-2-acetamido-2,6-beta-L-arabino-hexul-4-ose reductase
MKILVTGSKGFIGKNLILHLSEIENIEILEFDKDKTFDNIVKSIDSTDYIFHLAGVNRPNNSSEFYEGNTDLTLHLVELLKSKGLSVPIIYASSIQAELDNDYGKSKKQAEDLILDYGRGSLIYRFHNVFGKWCRPNYNSVVATFCNNIANGQDISIDDKDKEIELIYIDDIAYEFKKIITGGAPTEKQGNYCYIKPRYKATLGYVADTLKQFKDEAQTIFVPATGDEFVKKLHSTFVTYLPFEELIATAIKNTDNRGDFTELVRTHQAGQVSISTTKPGVTRGQHYHHTKIERFIVIKGNARVGFTNVLDDKDNYYFDVDDKEIKLVTIPPGYIHNIENIGKEDMTMVLWGNELFDKDYPDTYAKNVVTKGAKNLITKAGV